MTTTTASFRARLLARQTLVGTFLKTPTGHGVEIIGDAGFDFVVIDQEHAPFDRSSTDVALAIAHARGLPALVRVAGPENILSVLDGGAAGILVTHSRMAAETNMPSSVSSGLKLISTGNSLPSLRRPRSSSPEPMERGRGF